MLPFGLNPGGLAAGLLVLAIFGLPPLFRWARMRLRRRSVPPFVPGPPLSADTIERLRQWRESEIRACAAADIADAPPASPLSSRLGGQPWMADGEDWPLSRSGRPMIFVAQINFAETPPLPDYPGAGLLQVFIADDDQWGMNYDNQLEGDIRTIWRPEPVSGGARPHPEWERDMSPFHGLEPELKGRAITFRTGHMAPCIMDARVDHMVPDWWRAENSGEIETLLEQQTPDEPGPVYVGGHPRFTQQDVRDDAALADFDRVLLQVGYVPDVIMWGDVGEATWLIRREDLLKRDFSRVLFSWDCH